MTDVSFNRKDSCDKMSFLFSDNAIASKLSAKFIRKYSPKVMLSQALVRQELYVMVGLHQALLLGK